MVEIITLLFIITLPIAFLIWTLRFKPGLFSLIAVAPLSILTVTVIALNSEFDDENPPALTHTYSVGNCIPIGMNQTTTQIDPETQFTEFFAGSQCDSVTVTDTYVIGFKYMLILNLGWFLFMVAVTFVILRRVTRGRNIEND